METTIIKICRKCGEEKSLVEFIKRKDSKSGFGNICKKCRYNETKEWKLNNPEKVQESINRTSKQYYINNKEKYYNNATKWRKENRDRFNEIHRKYDNKRRINLDCNTVKTAISNMIKVPFNKLNLSEDIIEAKRQNILLFREKKKQKQLQTINN